MTVPPPDQKPSQEQDHPLRLWGILAGGGGIVVAIALALGASHDTFPAKAPPEAPASETAAPANTDAGSQVPPAPLAAPERAAPTPQNPDTQEARAPATPSRPTRAPAYCVPQDRRPQILVAFERSHPLGEAQHLFERGQRAQARELAGRLLADRRELRGLCLVRFNVGGAEIVLGAEDEAAQAAWVDRLKGMRGVAYAEANLAFNTE
jgi:hypothetical protein